VVRCECASARAVGPEVIEKVNNPLIFNGDTTGVKSPPIG
jgi:hypothetical protein